MGEYFPCVVQVIPNDDYTVQVFFDDGKITLYDMSAFLEKGIFTKLKDINVFKDCCTVMNNTLAWDLEGNRDESRCIDIDPFTLYDAPSVNNISA